MTIRNYPRWRVEFVRIENSAIRSAVPENPTLEQNMKWIGLPVAEIWPFEIFPRWRRPSDTGINLTPAKHLMNAQHSNTITFKLIHRVSKTSKIIFVMQRKLSKFVQ